MPRLSMDEVKEQKEYLSKMPERIWIGMVGLTSTETDLFDTIEAQNEELEKVKEEKEFFRKNWLGLFDTILAEIDQDGWCRLSLRRDEALKMKSMFEAMG